MSDQFQNVLLGLFVATSALLMFRGGYVRIVGTADGVALGTLTALLSAMAWTVSTVAMGTFFTLFAALFAAASAGFLASPEKVCAWHHLPLLCP